MVNSNFFSKGFHFFFPFQTGFFWAKVSTLSFGSFGPLKVLKSQLELNDNNLGLWTFILPLSLMSFFFPHLVLEVNSKFPPSDPSLPTHH
jgi:hypothetical protein